MTKHHDANAQTTPLPPNDVRRLRDSEYDARPLSHDEKVAADKRLRDRGQDAKPLAEVEADRKLRDPNYPYTTGQATGSALINDGKPGKVLPPERDVVPTTPVTQAFPAPRPGIKPAQRDKP